MITISTGTELMLGSVTDQDFSFIAKSLAQVGFPVFRHYTVGDDLDELQKVFAEALSLAHIVILSGGLGPTTDDLTRTVVSNVLKRPLKLDPMVLKDIDQKFSKRELHLPKSAEQQALILEDARVIPNLLGTAPGMDIEYQGKTIFLLPGPPFELKPMFERYVLPKIVTMLGEASYQFLSVRTFGIRESDVQEMMNTVFKDAPEFLNGLGYTSSPQGVDVRVAAKKKDWAGLLSLIHRLEESLKPWTYGINGENLEEIAAGLLMKQKKTLAVAESCTGGLLAYRLTGIAGISEVFKFGAVTYADEAKINLLGVSQKTLAHFGAVSQETALEMAQGVREKVNAEIGLSITGIAGPSGGTREKPVGLVWIGLVDTPKKIVQEYHFLGSRDTIQFKASQAALDMLRRYLIKKKNPE